MQLESPRFRLAAALASLLWIGACGGGSSDSPDAEPGASDAAAGAPDGASGTADAALATPDASNLPPGWTCGAFHYGDGVCDCGCGVIDDLDCTAPLTVDQCYYYFNGCPDGKNPDPDDPTRCVPSPTDWTCHWSDYYDQSCTCGCGVADPQCPDGAGLSDCQYDGCPSGQSPDPTEVTQCMTGAPQDSWTCDLALLYDGSQCDCGCGAEDPDCGPNPTADSCDVVHCGSKEELKPGQTAVCWEVCNPSTGDVGSATCTNGGYVNIFSSCERDLSSCTDGHRYQVECTAGDCVCRVDGQCVGRATGGCSFGATCGWSLIDNT